MKKQTTMTQQTAVDWLIELKRKYNNDVLLIDLVEAKRMEKEQASTFAIRVTSECCSIKNGKMEIDLHKFENLLNEMYGE